MSDLDFDARVAAQLERLYATRDFVRRREIVRGLVAARPGERILDAGCGPGFYVTELADEVGPDGSVIGTDASPDMLAVAAHRSAGRTNVELHHADATELPLDDASVDAALSVQVLEYVPDTGAAVAELFRVLRPGGRAVIWDIDWSTLSWHSSDPDRMRRVLDAWDDHLVHPALPRVLAARMRAAGFEDVELSAHVFATTERTPDSYGGAAVGMIGGFVPGHRGVSAEEAEAWRAEQADLGERGEFFFALVQCGFRGVRPG